MDSRTSKQSDQQKQLRVNESNQHGDQPEVITMAHSDDTIEVVVGGNKIVGRNKILMVHSDDITKKSEQTRKTK